MHGTDCLFRHFSTRYLIVSGMAKILKCFIVYLILQVDHAVSVIDNNPPRTYMHLHLKLKNLQVDYVFNPLRFTMVLLPCLAVSSIYLLVYRLLKG